MSYSRSTGCANRLTRLHNVKSATAISCSRSCLIFPSLSLSISKWWSQTGSNRRPHACKARALPTELWPRPEPPTPKEMVGLGRLELPTSRLSSARSNQLSYKPEAEPENAAPLTLRIAAGTKGSSEKKEKRRRRRPAMRAEAHFVLKSSEKGSCKQAP